MKKLLSIAFLFMMASIGSSAQLTNKVNNVATLYGQTTASQIKLFNCTFVVTNGNIVNRIAAFDANGVLIGTNAAPAASEAAALTNQANLFLAPFAQTINGATTLSNLTVRGVVAQTLSTTGTSNTWAASSNVFSGMIFVVGALKANNTGVTHELGGVAVAANDMGATSSIASLDLHGGNSAVNSVRVTGKGLVVTNFLAVSNTLFVAQTTQLGTNGSALIFNKTATATLDFGPIGANGYSNLTITVGGALENDVVSLGRPSAETNLIVTTGFVSANNTVTVKAQNLTGSTVDQDSLTYRVEVRHY